MLLICSYCSTPRRLVYGWEWDALSGWSKRVRRISWRCRSFARLRYSSEGGYLSPSYAGLGQLGEMLRGSCGNLLRPELWFPYVFSSLEAAREWLTAIGSGEMNSRFRNLIPVATSETARPGSLAAQLAARGFFRNQDHSVKTLEAGAE